MLRRGMVRRGRVVVGQSEAAQGVCSLKARECVFFCLASNAGLQWCFWLQAEAHNEIGCGDEDRYSREQSLVCSDQSTLIAKWFSNL
mmetsp:Transcript_33892/g.79988  ORF Transcript_33892/g.79988 Transcript_33892/m.79988 type:complete len:87 (-) Transcript_33892:4-264(-)